MTHDLIHNIPQQHITKAEDVRAYLVHVRGGAPFLSGADCQLLITWLDKEISVMAINTAIDRVAQKRRAKRTRSRMCLNNCRGELNKILKKKARPPKQLKEIVSVGLNGLATRIEKIEVPPPLEPHRETLVASLYTLSTQEGTVEKRAEKGTIACRIFHEEAWKCHSDQEEVLRVQAERELASLQKLLGTQHWREMVEEVMRDKLRSQFPLISAQSIWNAINLSEKGA